MVGPIEIMIVAFVGIVVIAAVGYAAIVASDKRRSGEGLDQNARPGDARVASPGGAAR